MFTGNIGTDIFAIIASIFILIVVLFKWSFGYWERRDVYTPKPTIPFGNAKDLLFQKVTLGRDIKNVYDDIKNKGNKFGGYYFFGKPVFIPIDLDLVKSIYVKDFMHFTNHLNTLNEEDDPLTGHLFNLKGAKWKHLRTKLTPAFSSGKMKMMFPTLVDYSDHLVMVIDRHIEEKQPIDIKEVTGRFSTDIIGSCAFGIECNSLENENSDFREYGKKTFKLTLWGNLIRLVSIGLPNLLVYLKIRTFRKDVCDFFTNIVQKTVNYREENKIVRNDLMHLLLRLKNNVQINKNATAALKSSNTPLLKMNELTAQAFIFFAAGFETSSTTLTFCLFELVQNPKLQDKVREEIDIVLERYNGKLTYDAVIELIYMEKCINETLRKYPPVPVHTRECTKTYRVPGTNLILNKGSSVFISVLGIQNDPVHYPDPDKFDPERFSGEHKARRHVAAWIPFGDGPRACIGTRFGIMQTKVGLTVLVKHFKFTLHPKTSIPLDFDPQSVILSVQEGIWLKAERI
ncbi:hypothetical protein ILUMI_09488 [Ignelater luminosus]|uniref:Cytochrome P450 n=1 Tax=Ignelater luminosus TaxID=2038154 RepID=A0A8K0D455_IGNLU|nr:hypothetical protein ILUMI_09488 [Ignelater luminosus]